MLLNSSLLLTRNIRNQPSKKSLLKQTKTHVFRDYYRATKKSEEAFSVGTELQEILLSKKKKKNQGAVIHDYARKREM